MNSGPIDNGGAYVCTPEEAAIFEQHRRDGKTVAEAAILTGLKSHHPYYRYQNELKHKGKSSEPELTPVESRDVVSANIHFGIPSVIDADDVETNSFDHHEPIVSTVVVTEYRETEVIQRLQQENTRLKDELGVANGKLTKYRDRLEDLFLGGVWGV